MKKYFVLVPVLLLSILSTVSAHDEFTDVTSTDVYYNAISYVHDEGIVKGYDDGTFKPDAPINRVEFLKVALTSHTLDMPCTKRLFTFSDTQSDAWYNTDLQTAANCGIISGYEDGSFKPGDPINYAEASKILSVVFGLETSSSSPWFQTYIDALNAKDAAPRVTIQPSDNLTRGEMAEIIYRLRVHPIQNADNLLSYIQAYDDMYSNISISWDDNNWYIQSNDLPSHDTGTFPNRGNPNTISAQDYHYTITRHPTKNNAPTPAQVPGVALNGVFFEPGTAETWNNNPSSGWNYEAIQSTLNLGLDFNNAHVQPNGSYHYHGIPTSFVEQQKTINDNDLVMVGLASDGFPMYVSSSNAYTSSYKLKSGTRPSGPGGTYDGTFTQDFEYVGDSGDLDECNGRDIISSEYPEGTYAYFITENFPYITRCVYGTPDTSFLKRPQR